MFHLLKSWIMSVFSSAYCKSVPVIDMAIVQVQEDIPVGLCIFFLTMIFCIVAFMYYCYECNLTFPKHFFPDRWICIPNHRI